jgi:hypothetical protein
MATLGYNPAALECIVVDKGHQVLHGRDGAVVVDVWGGCSFGNFAPSASRGAGRR